MLDNEALYDIYFLTMKLTARKKLSTLDSQIRRKFPFSVPGRLKESE